MNKPIKQGDEMVCNLLFLVTLFLLCHYYCSPDVLGKVVDIEENKEEIEEMSHYKNK